MLASPTVSRTLGSARAQMWSFLISCQRAGRREAGHLLLLPPASQQEDPEAHSLGVPGSLF